MIKKFTVVLIFIAAVGSLVFYDQVLSAFNGMSVIESIKVIWTFVLHVALGTVFAVILYQALELLDPLVKFSAKMLQRKRRNLRRGRFTQKIQSPRQPHAGRPRIGKDQILYWMMSQLMKRTPSSTYRNDRSEPPVPQNRLKF